VKQTLPCTHAKPLDHRPGVCFDSVKPHSSPLILAPCAVPSAQTRAPNCNPRPRTFKRSVVNSWARILNPHTLNPEPGVAEPYASYGFESRGVVPEATSEGSGTKLYSSVGYQQGGYLSTYQSTRGSLYGSVGVAYAQGGEYVTPRSGYATGSTYSPGTGGRISPSNDGEAPNHAHAMGRDWNTH
jgi:hypothetical protein